MQLNNFKSTWKQLKLLNAMQRIESKEILAIIENAENVNKTKSQRAMVNLIIFIALTICCQSG
ncbi:MAG: hypothetical protein AAGI25_11720 [Bacteroidota bacterium]